MTWPEAAVYMCFWSPVVLFCSTPFALILLLYLERRRA